MQDVCVEEQIVLTDDLQRNIRYPFECHQFQIWLYLFSMQLKDLKEAHTSLTFQGCQELGSHYRLGFVQSQKEEAAPDRWIYLTPTQNTLPGMRGEKDPSLPEGRALCWAKLGPLLHHSLQFNLYLDDYGFLKRKLIPWVYISKDRAGVLSKLCPTGQIQMPPSL